MAPVLLLVQLTQTYHTCVIRTALNLLDIQHVQRIILGLTFLKHAHLPVSKIYNTTKSLKIIKSLKNSIFITVHNIWTSSEKVNFEDRQ